jgi:hypothetical protein
MEIAMTKFALPLLAALTLAAPALADVPLRFQRDGLNVVGTLSQVGDVQYIRGQDMRSGREFDLQVKDGLVTGVIGGQKVAYAAPKKKVQLAAR